MNYSDLMAVMAEFHAGKASRAEMIGAIALWQRPVECARLDEIKRRMAIHFQVPFSLLWPGQKDPGDAYKLAVEAVIR